MLYLLDANILITANDTYYPLARVPEFWDWLVNCGIQGRVKVPREIYEEITKGKDRKGHEDPLKIWIKDNKNALLFDEEADVMLVKQVLSTSYAPDLNDVEIERIGADPFLISYALIDPTQRRVITAEVSRPSAQRANRKVPNVCQTLGVKSLTIFDLIEELDFTTGWQRRAAPPSNGA